ncbi:hypothetical protein MBCUT_05180 [Methanobrevibacter cuticularis]|uniref:DUF3368 domain-containing protein n=1 Tax=Methanobrevibacter cuticularis TaxID=47311 RepID=A0A166ELY1_9EURY|nr:hypothetical protein [Methanobrevibacter cuticularis]KZX16799.1 hypothetical protein MBCUT_05180 [Methanobrevibacter cuticularis]
MNLFDTSPIILFVDFIGSRECIDYLCRLGKNISISQEVYNEYYHETTYWLNNNLLKHYIENQKINLIKKDISEELSELSKRYPSLHEGELSIIALGKLCQKNSKNYLCVIDDKKARNIAKKLNLNLSGSIGLIKLLKSKNIFNENDINFIISDIENSKFYVSNDILMELKNG